jgi:hypothetical protein
MGTDCRAEVWGLQAPGDGPGFVTVTLAATQGPAPAPAVAATVVAYSNVASTSTDGACCANVTNDGTEMSTISKTIVASHRGDHLVDSVCVAWSGAEPGAATVDTASNPFLVARSVQRLVAPNLHALVATSLGANVDPPAMSGRSMRWLQSGSRFWALSGLILVATPTTALPDAAADGSASDAGAGDLGTAEDAALDAAGPAEEAGALPDGPVAEAGPDQGPPPDGNPGSGSDGGVDAGTAADAGDAALADAGQDGTSAGRRVRLAVGCACRMGAARRPGGLAVVLPVLLALRARRRFRSAGAPPGRGPRPWGWPARRR